MSDPARLAIEWTAFAVMCLAVLLLTVDGLVGNPCRWKLFFVPHISFLVLSGITLIGNHCDSGTISSENVHGLRFISTKLLQSKYSQLQECYVLPPLITANVCVLLAQTHLTVSKLIGPNIVNNLACYYAALGMVAVILFDSQTVSARQPRSHMHVSGVVLLTIGTFALHASTFAARLSINSDVLNLCTYKVCEIMYGAILMVFIIMFLLNEDAAVPLEYGVLFLFWLLSVVNLYILAEYEENADEVESDEQVEDLTDTCCGCSSEATLELVLIFLISSVFFMSYVSS